MRQNSQEDKPPEQIPKIIILVLTLVLLLAIGSYIFAVKPSERPLRIDLTLNNCFIYAPVIPYYPETKVYGSLINCLIKYESGGNEQAMGDEGKSHGILQFQVPTFKRYCIDMYGLAEEVDQIYNENIQMECAEKIIKDGGINNGSVKDKCL